MRFKGFLIPRLDAPLPLWMIFPVVFMALYASHFTLLRLPYYWDEAGYYIPAAWDFFRTGSLIPVSTLTNAHPPLPSIYLALWWKISGFYPEVTREAVLMVASLALLAVWRLAMRLIGVTSVAFWTVLLTGLYPIWFAQSSLAQADIFAAACSLWGLAYALPVRGRNPWAAALWFSAAALCKETAIAIPLTLAVVNIVESSGARLSARRRLWSDAAWFSGCVLPLAGWYAYHYAKTGFLFGNPEYLRYNAESTLAPLRILVAFGHRILHLTAHMNLFVPVFMAFAALLLNPRPDAEGKARATLSRPIVLRIFLLLLVNALALQRVGRRAAHPLSAAYVPARAAPGRFCLLSPRALLAWPRALHPRRPSSPGFSSIRRMDLRRKTIWLMRRWFACTRPASRSSPSCYPGATVLTAWPMTDELTKPELGYVKKPWDVWPIDDFSAAQIERAAQDPEKYSAALVFSTKYDPPSPLLYFGGQALDERYFGLHHDLPPELIAHDLGGTLVWRRDNDGMWIALIRFNHPVEARLEKEDSQIQTIVRR